MSNINQNDIFSKIFTEHFPTLFREVHEETRVPMQRDPVWRECEGHGEKVRVMYQGPACPYCLTLDDLEFTRERRGRD